MKIYVPTEITTTEQAEALPDGTHVVTFYDGVLEAPLIFVKIRGEFFDWSGDAFLLPSEIVPITALVEHEVREHKSRTRGEIGPGVGGEKALHVDFGKSQPFHERTVWSTEWKKSEDQSPTPYPWEEA